MTKKLYRNTEHKLLAGVLAGLAEYYSTDVVLWRLGAIVLLILTGFMPGVLIYVIAWIIIPEKPATETYRDAEYTVSE